MSEETFAETLIRYTSEGSPEMAVKYATGEWNAWDVFSDEDVQTIIHIQQRYEDELVAALEAAGERSYKSVDIRPILERLAK